MNELTILQPDTLANVAEIDVKVATANRYPRKIQEVKANLLDYATADKDTAEKCYYCKPVGKGSFAVGPSIRLMEIAAAVYKNVMHGIRVLEINKQDGYVKVQGVAFDLQNNISFSSEVTRSIKTKNGYTFSDNMIMTTINAAGAIADRNALAKVIPMGVFNNELKQIQNKAIEAHTDEDRHKLFEKAMDFLKKQDPKITKERVLKAMNVNNEKHITSEALILLRGVINAINDSETTVNEAFPEIASEKTFNKANAAMDAAINAGKK